MYNALRDGEISWDFADVEVGKISPHLTEEVFDYFKRVLFWFSKIII